LLALWTGLRYPEVGAVLFGPGFAFLVLWMFVAAFSAIYGSHRIGALREEALEAKSLGAYTLKRSLGSGGMGEVYLAEHRLLKRPCAIKLIRSSQSADPQAIRRFESEVQTTAHLTHPNTVEIYDFGHTEDGIFYYVMEYLPGLNLQELVDRFGPMPPGRVVYLLRQICSALSEAHGVGLVHRDIKPGNIFAAQRGGLCDVAKLLDFGLVKSVIREPESIRVTMEGTVLGSPLFAAPEHVTGEGETDPRTDIYSLGATAYFLLTGRPVFEGDRPLKVMFAHAHETPIPPSKLCGDVPTDLEQVVLRCLEKSPDARFPTAEALETALSRCGCTNDWTQVAARRWWANFDANRSDATRPRELAATTIMTVDA
jgi:serine/threonine-protein kinase